MPHDSTDQGPRHWFPNTTQTPNIFYDFIAPRLGEAELRVMLYLIRRTYGFQRLTDRVSLSQLMIGITREDGTQLDIGTGMSKSSILRGVKGLEQRGLIRVHRVRNTPGKATTTSEYSLNLAYLDSAGVAVFPDAAEASSAKLQGGAATSSAKLQGPVAFGGSTPVAQSYTQNLDQKQVTKEGHPSDQNEPKGPDPETQIINRCITLDRLKRRKVAMAMVAAWRAQHHDNPTILAALESAIAEAKQGRRQ